MDMHMPELDGYAAFARLRAAGYRGRIVALTAHALEDERRKCLRTGCDGFATKPILRRALIEVARSYLAPAGGPPLVSTLAADAEVAGVLDGFVRRLPERLGAMERALGGRDPGAPPAPAPQLKGAPPTHRFPPLPQAAAPPQAGWARRA